MENFLLYLFVIIGVCKSIFALGSFMEKHFNA